MVKISCYTIDENSRNSYPINWPTVFPCKPEIGDKIESLDCKNIGIVTDIIYKTDSNGKIYAELHLSR